MLIIKDTAATDKKKRRIILELDAGEELKAFKADSFYMLGNSVAEIVTGETLLWSEKAQWCEVEQTWVT